MNTMMTAGKSATEIKAMRDTLRFDGVAPDGTVLRGPAKYAATVALTEALAAAEREEGKVPAFTSPRRWTAPKASRLFV